MPAKYTRTATFYIRQLSNAQKTVETTPEQIRLAYDEARKSHAIYLNCLKSLGYSYAPDNNDDPEKGPLTNSEIMDFALLDDWQQDNWMASTETVYNLYTAAHKNISKNINVMLFMVAEDIHNALVSDMIREGWVYGDKNNNSPNVCAGLLPFNILLDIPEFKCYTDYTIELARTLLINMFEHAKCIPPLGTTKKRGSDIFKS